MPRMVKEKVFVRRVRFEGWKVGEERSSARGEVKGAHELRLTSAPATFVLRNP